ncbi:MAG: MarR family transcriptional regulator [Rhizobiaceae bacterium]|nr:MarR family transcriptional regulator [Rhizobiaceae bacterium]
MPTLPDADAKSGWIDAETKVAEAPADHGDELRLWLRLLTCSTLVETEVRRRLREEFDFTLPRFDLLAQLERAVDGMVLGALSKRMMVSAGNLTALVERMVESGHVSRTTSPADRRVQIIALTDHGRAAFRTMADRHGDWIGSLFADLSAQDRKALMAGLARLKGSVRRALDAPSQTG